MLQLKQFSDQITESINAHGIGSFKQNIDYKPLNIKSNVLWAYIPLHFKANVWFASSLVGNISTKQLDWYLAQRASQVILYVGNNGRKWAILIQKNRMMFNIYDSSGVVNNDSIGTNVYQYIIKPNLSIIK